VLDWVKAKFKPNGAVHAVDNVQGPVHHINNAARNKDISTNSLMALVFTLTAASVIVPVYIMYGSHFTHDQVRELYRAAFMINSTLVNLALPCIVYFKSKGLRRHVKESLRSILGQLNIEL